MSYLTNVSELHATSIFSRMKMDEASLCSFTTQITTWKPHISLMKVLAANGATVFRIDYDVDGIGPLMCYQFCGVLMLWMIFIYNFLYFDQESACSFLRLYIIYVVLSKFSVAALRLFSHFFFFFFFFFFCCLTYERILIPSLLLKIAMRLFLTWPQYIWTKDCDGSSFLCHVRLSRI
jgi:hypothetical protein